MLTDADPMILYVLMRTDLLDPSPGKGMAQANHAGTQFMKRAAGLTDHSFRIHFEEWFNAADGFGICVVLGVTHMQMITRTAIAQALGLCADTIHDPSYPMRDGHIIQHLPVNTCSFVFGRKSRCTLALGGLSLF